ncbi:MAG: diacylglycerol kinase family lipid kinase [Acidobacteriaceae bacterium]|nr:diacylglycerol kinase family lipid kinase [Acidobacteriaceae bacterium]
MRQDWMAIINPVAGAGRAGKLAGAALNTLRQSGLRIEERITRTAGEGVLFARDAYESGYRKFIAVGGDGTAYEIVNGIFPQALAHEPPTLAFLPLGTGNSFLRDFTKRGAAHAQEALLSGTTRQCDVMRLHHSGGVLYYINLLSVGFAADVAFDRAERFRHLGEFGYLLGVFTRLISLDRRAFPLRVDDELGFDLRPCLFLTFNNSKFTGGTMMIAPNADPTDGLIEYVRWGAIGRAGLVWNLRRLYDGTHVHHPLAERRPARRIEFKLEGPVNVMIDGEVARLQLQSIQVLPGALKVVV